MRSQPMASASRHLVALLALALCASLVSACADDTSSEDDSDATDTTMNGDTMPPTGDLLYESPDPLQEFPDCFNDCPHDGPLSIFDFRQYDGLVGTIDGACHPLTNGENGDIDLIGLTVEPRTMLEIVVEPTEGSAMDPVVITHTGVIGGSMTYNNARSEGATAARTMLAAPVNGEVPFYVYIEHFPNYNNDAGSCDEDVGGDNYEYVLRIDEVPFEPIELGELSVGGTASGSGSLSEGGDVVYFRFTAPATASPVVTITNTGSSDFIPSAAGMDTNGGLLAWTQLKADGQFNDNVADGTVTLSADSFDVCPSDLPDNNCETATGEFMFVVLDWNGQAWPGEFTFDVDVSL